MQVESQQMHHKQQFLLGERQSQNLEQPLFWVQHLQSVIHQLVEALQA